MTTAPKSTLRGCPPAVSEGALAITPRRPSGAPNRCGTVRPSSPA